MMSLSVALEEVNGAEFSMWIWRMSVKPVETRAPPSETNTPTCISFTNHSCDFFLSLSAHLFLCRLQLRKDKSSISEAQSGGSSAASLPADTPRPPESAVEKQEEEEEGKGEGSGEKAEGEAPKGSSLAQEDTTKQEGVCG